MGRVYLDRWILEFVWGSNDRHREFLNHVVLNTSSFDKQLLTKLIHQLIAYEAEFSATAANELVRKFYFDHKGILSAKMMKWLSSSYFINQAFRKYQMGEFSIVPLFVLRAILSRPSFVFNRGVLAIFFRSMIGIKAARNG